MFTGCGTAIVTPFTQDRSLDEATLRNLVRRQIHAGINFLVPCGTTGESPTLERAEHLRVVEITLEEAKGIVPVLAGAGGYNTGEVIDLARELQTMGADGILSVTPYYNKPTQEGMYQHFKAIAENTSLPLMLYNIPGRTGVNMNTDTLLRLAEIKNYFSVKEASGNLDQIREVINRVPKNFMVYSGDDGLTLDVLKMGGFGVVSVASHLVGKQIKQMICLAKAGKIAEAEVLNQKLQDVFKVLFIISNPSPLKAAMNLIGFKAGGVRLPLVMPNATELAQIKKALDALALTV